MFNCFGVIFNLPTLDSRINMALRSLIFVIFFPGATSLLKGVTFIIFGFLIFFYLFTLVMYKKCKLSVFWEGATFIKGAKSFLLFLTTSPTLKLFPQQFDVIFSPSCIVSHKSAYSRYLQARRQYGKMNSIAIHSPSKGQ